VVGYDVDEARIKRLAGGESYVEDVTNVDLARPTASGRFRATTHSDDLAGFDVAIISVPTPLAEETRN